MQSWSSSLRHLYGQIDGLLDDAAALLQIASVMIVGALTPDYAYLFGCRACPTMHAQKRGQAEAPAAGPSVRTTNLER